MKRWIVAVLGVVSVGLFFLWTISPLVSSLLFFEGKLTGKDWAPVNQKVSLNSGSVKISNVIHTIPGPYGVQFSLKFKDKEMTEEKFDSIQNANNEHFKVMIVVRNSKDGKVVAENSSESRAFWNASFMTGDYSHLWTGWPKNDNGCKFVSLDGCGYQCFWQVPWHKPVDIEIKFSGLSKETLSLFSDSAVVRIGASSGL